MAWRPCFVGRIRADWPVRRRLVDLQADPSRDLRRHQIEGPVACAPRRAEGEMGRSTGRPPSRSTRTRRRRRGDQYMSGQGLPCRPHESAGRALPYADRPDLMNLRSILPDRNSIATRLAGWFLLIALMPCVFLLAVTAYFSQAVAGGDGSPAADGDLRRQGDATGRVRHRAQGGRSVLVQRAGDHRGRDPARSAPQGRQGEDRGLPPRIRTAPAQVGCLRRGQFVREFLSVQHRRGVADLVQAGSRRRPEPGSGASERDGAGRGVPAFSGLAPAGPGGHAALPGPHRRRRRSSSARCSRRE